MDGLGLDLLDALTLLAKDRVGGGGLRLVGEDGLLPVITQHLMQAALEAELEEHLAAEARERLEEFDASSRVCRVKTAVAAISPGSPRRSPFQAGCPRRPVGGGAGA